MPATAVRHHYVHLADNEWQSNTDMREIAQAHIEEHGPADPDSILVVTVYEHAGWSLTYALLDNEVTVIGSANDAARYSDDVEAVRLLVRTLPLKREDVNTFRRGADE
jgi:hypothetical protein